MLACVFDLCQDIWVEEIINKKITTMLLHKIMIRRLGSNSTAYDISSASPSNQSTNTTPLQEEIE